jgi:hypothetical protein
MMEELTELMSMQGSYCAYREELKRAQQNPPCIPYMYVLYACVEETLSFCILLRYIDDRGVCLSDLTFIDDGNPDTIDNLINWTKCKMIYKATKSIQELTQVV